MRRIEPEPSSYLSTLLTVCLLPLNFFEFPHVIYNFTILTHMMSSSKIYT